MVLTVFHYKSTLQFLLLFYKLFSYSHHKLMLFHYGMGNTYMTSAANTVGNTFYKQVSSNYYLRNYFYTKHCQTNQLKLFSNQTLHCKHSLCIHYFHLNHYLGCKQDAPSFSNLGQILKPVASNLHKITNNRSQYHRNDWYQVLHIALIRLQSTPCFRLPKVNICYLK